MATIWRSCISGMTVQSNVLTSTASSRPTTSIRASWRMLSSNCCSVSAYKPVLRSRMKRASPSAMAGKKAGIPRHARPPRLICPDGSHWSDAKAVCEHPRSNGYSPVNSLSVGCHSAALKSSSSMIRPWKSPRGNIFSGGGSGRADNSAAKTAIFRRPWTR